MRTPEQIREHYEIEKELAARLRNAQRSDRIGLYGSVYDELFRRLPHHPQLARKVDPLERRREALAQVDLLRRFLEPGQVFLQLGPGDCEMAFEVARMVRVVYAVDVSEEITRSASVPGNFELRLSDGTSVPVPPESIDVAYSNQLMEHLHPEDALEQVRNVFAALKPGGIYICLTPNRLRGPHDISKHFDEVATGLHLKEYTTSELAVMFREAGFKHIAALYDATGKLPPISRLPVAYAERMLDALPGRLGKALARFSPVAKLIGVRLVARK
ncbi:MAG: class I SAM-dependent methyltransferase [Chitinivibrionia bacterium]|nr:class I SAM-dependent methyltransferase [Chitinivibrionia bacterium]